MTQEEKAQAYDEVVARINKAVSDGLVSENFGRDMLGIAESEDEKIRKELSKFLWDVANGEVKSMPSASQCQEWLAYLEKQKEKNVEGDFARGYDCGYECCLNSHGAEWFEKQKEQKPADCVPDSVKFDEGFKTGREVGFREGVESVKPVEWSEEEFAHIVGYLVQDIVANEHMPETEKQPTRAFVEKYYNKLRPQPHWKPSEEQMEAFHVLLGKVPRSPELYDLYGDLEKLM